MFASAIVREWRTDGGRRVHPGVTTVDYILNTNRMFDLHETSHLIPGGKNKQTGMWYFDNPLNWRDGGAYLRCERTITTLKTQSGHSITYSTITLNVFPDNDMTQDTYELTIGKAAIAYAWAPDLAAVGTNGVYVVYIDAAWGIRRVLCNTNMTALYVELLD